MTNEPISHSDFLALLNAALPFSASVNKHALFAQASREHRPLRNKQKLRIESVVDSGDIGGIVCTADLGADKGVVAISLTHLRFEPSHPLYKQIRAYQIQRTKDLAAGRLARDRGGSL
jgi:hypothetical protein